MKLPCEMIQDLLPLYHDGVCSQVSNTLVREHLKDCESCSAALKAIDAEIEVPKLAADEGKPLQAIQTKWEKQKGKTKHIAIAFLVVCILFLGWIGMKELCIIPMTPEDFIIGDICHFSDGSYFMKYHKLYFKCNADIHVLEDGSIYYEYRRALLEEKVEPRTSGSYGILIDPNVDHYMDKNGNYVYPTALYLGKPGSEDAILLWDIDMDIPVVSPEVEAEYQDMIETYRRVNELVEAQREAQRIEKLLENTAVPTE